MRRPVKPFVTEYKAPNRRSQASPGSSPRRLKGEVGAAPANESYHRHGGDNGGHGGGYGEDAYEAAMRAADALFSPTSRRAPDSEPVSPSHSVKDDRMVKDNRVVESETDPRNGGRVLRVIDEAPQVDLEALDAERAPKRRGRKPGSKNKPKIAPPEAVTENQAQAYRPEADDAVEDPEIIESADTREEEPVAIAARHVSPQAVRSAPPFAWVKRKLAPGEQWKRRLPKVCW